jgi:DNA-directed RNA polymerase subunit M/transcription elongation factor TFIIS
MSRFFTFEQILHKFHEVRDTSAFTRALKKRPREVEDDQVALSGSASVPGSVPGSGSDQVVSERVPKRAKAPEGVARPLKAHTRPENEMLRLRHIVWSTLERVLESRGATTGSPAGPCAVAVREYARSIEETLYWLHFCSGGGGIALRMRKYITDVVEVAETLATRVPAATPLPDPRLVIDQSRSNCTDTSASESVLATAEAARRDLERLCDEALEDSEYTQVVICLKCRVGPVRFDFKQTRSADEGMTCFFECVNCGARWKS